MFKRHRKEFKELSDIQGQVYGSYFRGLRQAFKQAGLCRSVILVISLFIGLFFGLWLFNWLLKISLSWFVPAIVLSALIVLACLLIGKVISTYFCRMKAAKQ